MREPERNQMPYYNLGPTIKPTKKSMAARPATRYETESPGPGIYDLGTTVVVKSLSIGVRSSQRDPKAEVPAPGSYWIVPPSTKPPPIVGFVGPTDRCPVNLSAESQKPGPGPGYVIMKVVEISHRAVEVSNSLSNLTLMFIPTQQSHIKDRGQHLEFLSSPLDFAMINSFSPSHSLHLFSFSTIKLSDVYFRLRRDVNKQFPDIVKSIQKPEIEKL
jgi:hypothetical protein